MTRTLYICFALAFLAGCGHEPSRPPQPWSVSKGYGRHSTGAFVAASQSTNTFAAFGLDRAGELRVTCSPELSALVIDLGFSPKLNAGGAVDLRYQIDGGQAVEATGHAAMAHRVVIADPSLAARLAGATQFRLYFTPLDATEPSHLDFDLRGLPPALDSLRKSGCRIS